MGNAIHDITVSLSLIQDKSQKQTNILIHIPETAEAIIHNLQAYQQAPDNIIIMTQKLKLK